MTNLLLNPTVLSLVEKSPWKVAKALLENYGYQEAMDVLDGLDDMPIRIVEKLREALRDEWNTKSTRAWNRGKALVG